MGVDDVGGFLMGLATGTLMGGALGFMFLAGAAPPPPPPPPPQGVLYVPGRTQLEPTAEYVDPTTGRRLVSGQPGQQHRHYYNPARPYTAAGRMSLNPAGAMGPRSCVGNRAAAQQSSANATRDAAPPHPASQLPASDAQRILDGPETPMTQQQLAEVAARAATISKEFKERQRQYYDLREQIRELQKLDISAKITESTAYAAKEEEQQQQEPQGKPNDK